MHLLVHDCEREVHLSKMLVVVSLDIQRRIFQGSCSGTLDLHTEKAQ